MPLFRDPDTRKLEELPEVTIEGDFREYTVVSVPDHTSIESAKRIRGQVQEALQDRRVLVLTHNIQLLMLRRLSSSEAAKAIASIDKQIHPDKPLPPVVSKDDEAPEGKPDAESTP